MARVDLTPGVALLQRGVIAVAVCLLAMPGIAAAQGDDADTDAQFDAAEGGGDGDGGDDIEKELLDTAAEGDKPEGTADEDKELGDIGSDVLEVFILDRGFYVSSDLGVFLTLGGARGYSNVQPYMAVKVGFDIGDYFGIQLDLSTGYSSGNPASNADRPVGDSDRGGYDNFDATVNYGVFNAGLEVVGAIRPTQRLAIEPKLGGGFTFIDPPLSKVPSAGAAIGTLLEKHGGAGGHFVVGVDIKYLTLLSNFTAGASVNFYGFVGAHGFIPALGVGAVVRYTL